MSRVLHVQAANTTLGDGSSEQPFSRIQMAAEVAMPGDTVLVHAGEYREWVRPRRGGLSETQRIVYAVAPGEKVVIKGSEPVTQWEQYQGSVWTARIPNTVFGDFNPFQVEMDGDWIVYGADSPKRHLGEVYLNGQSLYEADSLAAVLSASATESVVDHWTGVTVPVSAPNMTGHRWFANVSEQDTQLWVNFGAADPTVELVEVNARRSVFYPEQHHLDYITVRGFEMAHAATPWSPPTADQPGMVGPNWAKGWIIEDNHLHDAKASAISIGKEASTGDGFASLRGDKPGYQYQLESVFAALQHGWSRETIGSHVIRRNTIHDCGQNAIVGHLGCIFSDIIDNDIFRIGVKREYYGYEIAGIKLHAPLDVTIEGNRIHDCSLGIWLDWQTQGTRIHRNVFYRNRRDLFVEVSHGPFVVDHNVFASPVALELACQGGAFVNNLIAGTVRIEAVRDRSTPYHFPHSTAVKGCAIVETGDDRFVNNLFLSGNLAEAYGPDSQGEPDPHFGTGSYTALPHSWEEYLDRVNADEGDHEKFWGKPQAATLRGNVYGPGCEQAEEDSLVVEHDFALSVADTGEKLTIHLDVPAELLGYLQPVVRGDSLPPVRFAGAGFEDRDGSVLTIGEDLTGLQKQADQHYPAGPFAALQSGPQSISW